MRFPISSVTRSISPALAIVLVALSAQAATPHADRARDGGLSQRRGLLQDWGDFRTWLAQRGLSVDLTYTAEVFQNLSGGLRTGGAYRGELSLLVGLGTDAAGWWRNGELTLFLEQLHGNGISERYAGDVQTLSNIDADDFFQLSELHYRHGFLDERLWLKLGKQDANEDFAHVEYGLEFIHSSPGLIPTTPLPTFPDQDWGVMLGAAPLDWLSVQLGVYQGSPDGGRSPSGTIHHLRGPLVLLEPAIHYSLGGQPGHLRLGARWNGLDVERLDGTGHRGASAGFYATWDQRVFTEPGDDLEGAQGIGVFAQLGHSDEEVSQAARYLGLGFEWRGAIPTRDADILGLGVFHLRLSDDGFERRSETAIEIFYKVQLLGFFSLKLDAQYILDPGGVPGNDALVFGVRSEIAF